MPTNTQKYRTKNVFLPYAFSAHKTKEKKRENDASAKICELPFIQRFSQYASSSVVREKTTTPRRREKRWRNGDGDDDNRKNRSSFGFWLIFLFTERRKGEKMYKKQRSRVVNFLGYGLWHSPGCFLLHFSESLLL